MIASRNPGLTEVQHSSVVRLASVCEVGNSMIIFDMSCVMGHKFEGWFKSAEDYAAQKDRKMLSCPVCDCSEVNRLPSASYIQRSQSSPNRKPAVGEAMRSETGPNHLPLSSADLQEAVSQFKDYIQNQTEDVGTRFGEETRKMHYGEVDKRAIRGVASIDECLELKDEGIDVLPFPAHWAGKKQIN